MFVDVKDRYGLVQVFAHSSDDVFASLIALNREDVIQVSGIIQERKQVNEKLATGLVELHAQNLHVYSKAQTTPLIIEDQTDANEDVRLKYRYLDLRRDVNLKHLYYVVK